MDFKSIQNTGIVNLTNCDSEPIHIPGSIQPHGFLLALNANNVVEFCSNNLHVFGLSVAATLGKGLNEIFTTPQAAALDAYLQAGIFEGAKPFICHLKNSSYSTSVHRSGIYLIVEFEPYDNHGLELADLYRDTRNFTVILGQTFGLQPLCQAIAGEIKNITGYHRVMIYRFDENYNGEVYAEACEEHLEPFLGLHYPHTDIPVQARRLYLTNLLRMIGDVNYTPVPLVTYNSSASHQSLDLSLSILRSTSPIHVEYLKNMGVAATLTISLITDNRLWGLIACHHYVPRVVPNHVRLSALLQGHFLTSQIKVQEVAEDYRFKAGLEEKLEAFLKVLNPARLKREKEIPCAELAAVTNAGGVCILSGRFSYCFGNVPPADNVKELLLKLEGGGDVIYSNNIYKDYGLSMQNGIAGFLYYKLDADTAIIWYRNELKKEINWGGDPGKAIELNSKGLSPRKSFAVWKETVNNYSSNWLPAELTIANQCVYAVQKALAGIKSKKVEKKQKDLLKKLQQANAELENINWISTHDLREPLRKISVFSSLLLDREKFSFDENATHLLNRLATAAARMQHLVDDLLTFNKIKSEARIFERCSLNQVLENVLNGYKEEIEEKQIKIQAAPLPEIYGVPVLLRQLFTNLVGNALKFMRPGAGGRLQITGNTLNNDNYDFVEIKFADNGIGFDNEYREQIFHVFQRLDKALNFQGTGIGLAICQRIVDIHKGKISASGHLNKGATFTIQLPVNPSLSPE